MMTVIVADDEPLIREGLQVMLDWEGLGFRISGAAEDGALALQLLREIKPDIAVIDIKMPFYSGIDLMRIAHEEQLSTLFIIASGFDSFANAQKAITHGAFRYLLKPIDASELECCLLDAAKQHRQKREQQQMLTEARAVLTERQQDQGQLQTPLIHIPDVRNASIRRVLHYIHYHLDGDLSLSELAKIAYVHPNYLSGMFKEELGENLIDYIVRSKVEKAKELVKSAELRSYEISEQLGYKDARYFAEVFKKHTGMTIAEFKKHSSVSSNTKER